jgi:hypothetical protein
MPTAIAHLKSVSQYSQSRYLLAKKDKNEDYDQFEQRIWRDRAHIVEAGPDAGKVFIPPMAFKQALDSAAKYSPVKKKGQATYTKHFLSGVLCMEPLVLPMTKDDLSYYAGPMSSTGEKGKSGGSVVIRIYPIVPEWEGDVTFHVIDDTLHKDVFLSTLEVAGKNIGIGRFRPQNGGFNGRFVVESFDWKSD